MSSRSTPATSSNLTRRKFVATATAAASVAVVRPSAVRGSEANSKIKVGCIGLGKRGTWMANLFKVHGGYGVTAVADYFPDISRCVGTKLGVAEEKCFSGLLGYQRVIDSGVDAMVLETPTYCFPDHATAAVEAGCHVYMAKPIAVDVPGSLTIGECGKKATASEQVFLVDFQLRVDPYLQECVRQIRAGVMGDIRFMRTFYDDEGRADPPLTNSLADRFRNLIWTMSVELGGDRIVAAGIHAIDAMVWIAGETPSSCVGRAMACREDPHGDSTDTYSLTYKFPSGLIANYSGDQFRNYHGFNAGCDVYGWRSYMETHYAGSTWLQTEKGRYEGGESKSLYSDGARTNVATFHKSITGGVYDNPTVEPSVDANLTAILGREAGRRGTELTWDELIQENKSIRPDLSGLVQ